MCYVKTGGTVTHQLLEHTAESCSLTTNITGHLYMMCEFGVPSKEQDYPWHRLVMVVRERMDKRYPEPKRVSRPM